jgi:hypothetical protein
LPFLPTATIDYPDKDEEEYSPDYLARLIRFMASVIAGTTNTPAVKCMTLIDDVALQLRNWTLEAVRRGTNIYISIYLVEIRQRDCHERPSYTDRSNGFEKRKTSHVQKCAIIRYGERSVDESEIRER